ncbi:hypothetical protein COLO4_05954 [Corchorus olitorius]|uniref:Retroviral aspartyl protease n=1 Tax=Corchorus olitorius TaxID=93759 RepID=A0A1R3KPJ0_9ROSI|nr:hypothetical protein COLO4_05954 [Corchorus olitorius]
MGDGISTRVQKEIHQLQQSQEKLKADMKAMAAQLRTELRADLQSGLDSSFAKMSADLKQSMELVFQRQGAFVDSSQGSPMEPTKTPFIEIECPRFNGDDFMGWHSRIEQFFIADNTPENQKIGLVMMHLEGRALQFHLHFMRTKARHLEQVYFQATPNPKPYYKQSAYTANSYSPGPRTPNKTPLVSSTPTTPMITYPPSNPNSPTKPEPTNPRNLTMPTREERTARRKKGLCMWCSQKFSPGHKCGVKSQFYQILLEDNIDPPENEDLIDLGEYPDNSTGGNNTPDSPPIITLNALLGTSGPQTMRVFGRVKNQSVLMLIDTGSSHNFLNSSLAKRLGCHLSSMKSIPVTVANGEDLICKERCKALEWEVQGIKQVTETLTIMATDLLSRIKQSCEQDANCSARITQTLGQQKGKASHTGVSLME